MSLPQTPKEPEFLLGGWFYDGVQRATKDQVYRIYNADLAAYWLAMCERTASALESLQQRVVMAGYDKRPNDAAEENLNEAMANAEDVLRGYTGAVDKAKAGE